MRKDVRLGLAVGGVLLAIILVGIIIGRQKKNEVGFDGGAGKGIVKGSDDQPEALDPTAPKDNSSKAGQPQSSPPSPASPATHEPREQPDKNDDADKVAAKQWEALFASTAADPIKAQLTTTPKAVTTDGPVTSDTGAATDGSRNAAPASAGEPARRTSGGSARDDTSPSTRPSSFVPSTHKVQAGETLSSIARTYYGEARYYLAIQKANPNLDPKRIRPGTTINLPPASQVKETAQESGPSRSRTARAPVRQQAAVDSSKRYVVQSGDTLSHIALKLYGRRDKAEELYINNKDVIGSDSGRLKIGMVLKLPEAPTASASR